MPGKLPTQVSAPHWIHVEVIGVRRNVRGIVTPHPDMPIDRKSAVLEFGVSAHLQLAAFGRHFHIHSAGEFPVERKVIYMDGSIDYWSIERARAPQREVGSALHGQFIQMNLPDPCQIEISSTQVQAKAARRRSICGRT